MQYRTKHFSYNPATIPAGVPNSPLNILLTRGWGRDLGGQSQYVWHLEGGTFHGYNAILAVYLVSLCELRVYPPTGTSGDVLETVRSHSEEEGLAALGFTVELY